MNCSVSFGSLNPGDYDQEYRRLRFKNGILPDKKILQTMQKYCPHGGDIWDDQGGDGRNAVPLAKRGFKVDVTEQSSEGRAIMAKRAKKLPNLQILDRDILESSLHKDKYDGICMAHVSQHFDNFELETTIKDFYYSLKKGGIAIFDALVDKMKFEEQNIMDIFEDTDNGYAHFEQEFIEDAARKTGFDIIDISDYKEGFLSRGRGYNYRKWGFGTDTTKDAVRPVKLKWFTLRK